MAGSLQRLGAVASLSSEPVLTGFKAGEGLVIVLDQLPKLLGVHYDKGPFLHNRLALVGHLPDTSVATLLLGTLKGIVVAVIVSLVALA